MKATLTSKPKPIRIDPATAANLEIIIASGIASNTSAAFRAATAALAHGLVADPRVWVVSISGLNPKIFATHASAVAWLQSQGATESHQGEWYTTDDDGDPHTWYTIAAIVPQ